MRQSDHAEYADHPYHGQKGPSNDRIVHKHQTKGREGATDERENGQIIEQLEQVFVVLRGGDRMMDGAAGKQVAQAEAVNRKGNNFPWHKRSAGGRLGNEEDTAQDAHNAGCQMRDAVEDFVRRVWTAVSGDFGDVIKIGKPPKEGFVGKRRRR